MGEFADIANQRWDDGDWEDDEEDEMPLLKTCRCCGDYGFHWRFDSSIDKWRLFDWEGNIHKCTKVPLK